jgi:hypothetical protein
MPLKDSNPSIIEARAVLRRKILEPLLLLCPHRIQKLNALNPSLPYQKYHLPHYWLTAALPPPLIRYMFRRLPNRLRVAWLTGF